MHIDDGDLQGCSRLKMRSPGSTKIGPMEVYPVNETDGPRSGTTLMTRHNSYLRVFLPLDWWVKGG